MVGVGQKGAVGGKNSCQPCLREVCSDTHQSHAYSHMMAPVPADDQSGYHSLPALLQTRTNRNSCHIAVVGKNHRIYTGKPAAGTCWDLNTRSVRVTVAPQTETAGEDTGRWRESIRVVEERQSVCLCVCIHVSCPPGLIVAICICSPF